MSKTYNSVTLSWNDSDNQYCADTEHREDWNRISEEGFNHLTVDTFCCTTKEQAERQAKMILFLEKKAINECDDG